MTVDEIVENCSWMFSTHTLRRTEDGAILLTPTTTEGSYIRIENENNVWGFTLQLGGLDFFYDINSRWTLDDKPASLTSTDARKIEILAGMMAPVAA